MVNDRGNAELVFAKHSARGRTCRELRGGLDGCLHSSAQWLSHDVAVIEAAIAEDEWPSVLAGNWRWADSFAKATNRRLRPSANNPGAL